MVCVFIGRSLASLFTMVLFVSDVLPVAILAMVFWIVCKWLLLVSDMIGDQVVEEYSIIGSVMVLYVFMRVSLSLPHVVPERAL